jgi:D-alanine--poly(phosphoribitol) ligase subunit 2
VTDTNAIIGRLGALFVESLHIEAPSVDTDLFETGILDSLQLVELLLQLEQRFGFRIKIDDIDLEDLRTLARIARLVAARTAAAGSQVTPLAGRAEANRASTIGSTRDSVSDEPVLRSGSVR